MEDRSEITAEALDSVITRLKRLRDAGIREISVPVVKAPEPVKAASSAPVPIEPSVEPPTPTGPRAADKRPAAPGTPAPEVPGMGPVGAPVAFVGGAPDESSRAAATPFAESGEEGQLLSRMIAAMGLERNGVYLTYVVKRVVAGAQGPTEAEVAESAPALLAELTAARPGVVVAFGAEASTAMLGSPDVAGLRGRFHECGGLAVMPTYSPELMLMDVSLKGPVWKDMLSVMKRLGIEPPGANSKPGQGAARGA